MTRGMTKTKARSGNSSLHRGLSFVPTLTTFSSKTAIESRHPNMDSLTFDGIIRSEPLYNGYVTRQRKNERGKTEKERRQKGLEEGRKGARGGIG